jgi:hypothetical protein
MEIRYLSKEQSLVADAPGKDFTTKHTYTASSLPYVHERPFFLTIRDQHVL